MVLAQFVDHFRAAAAVLPSAGAAAPPPAPALNALALLWALVKGWLAGLFGRRA